MRNVKVVEQKHRHRTNNVTNSMQFKWLLRYRQETPPRKLVGVARHTPGLTQMARSNMNK